MEKRDIDRSDRMCLTACGIVAVLVPVLVGALICVGCSESQSPTAAGRRDMPETVTIEGPSVYAKHLSAYYCYCGETFIAVVPHGMTLTVERPAECDVVCHYDESKSETVKSRSKEIK